MRPSRREPLVGVLSLTLLALAAALLIGLTRSDAPEETRRHSEDRAVVARLVSGYVATIPTAGSGEYRVPSAEELQAVADAWRALAKGDIDSAARLSAPFGYDADERGGIAFLRGSGGLFVRAPSGTAVVVEVPHPVADWETEEIGAELFAEMSAGALLVAGAHRSSADGNRADVAHREDTVFHAVHVAASGAGPVLQVHGFSDDTAPFDVVVSRGATPSATTRRVSSALGQSFRTCLWRPAEIGRCDRLSARSNVQGRQLRRTGGEFVHVELSRSLRDDSASRRRAVMLLASALVATAEMDGSGEDGGP